VRGHRIQNADGGAMVTADAIQIRPVFIAPFLAIPLLFVLLLYILISTSAKNRKSRDLKEEYFAEKGLKEVEEEIEDQDIVLEAVEEFMEKRKSRRK